MHLMHAEVWRETERGLKWVSMWTRLYHSVSLGVAGMLASLKMIVVFGVALRMIAPRCSRSITAVAWIIGGDAGS